MLQLRRQPKHLTPWKSLISKRNSELQEIVVERTNRQDIRETGRTVFVDCSVNVKASKKPSCVIYIMLLWHLLFTLDCLHKNIFPSSTGWCELNKQVSTKSWMAASHELNVMLLQFLHLFKTHTLQFSDRLKRKPYFIHELFPFPWRLQLPRGIFKDHALMQGRQS
jgi:hypothetical protein